MGNSLLAVRDINHKYIVVGGIYIVPVGELECFIKEVGGHGPEWSNIVLETYPDLNNEVYDAIKKFVRKFS